MILRAPEFILRSARQQAEHAMQIGGRIIAGHPEKRVRMCLPRVCDAKVVSRRVNWQWPGQVGSGFLTRFNSQIVGLAGYSSAGGYQQVIVATDDGTVTEVYWQGPNPPSQGALSHFDSRILAIAGYSSGDGYQHVIVATEDSNLSEVYWLTSDVGRGALIHVDSPVVDLAGYEARGVHHVIAATTDGTLTELTWSGPAAASARTLARLEAQPWNHVLGVGAYDAAQEQHVIVGMSNGTLREFHTPPGDSQNPPPPLHTDLVNIPGMMPIIDAYTEASGDQHTIVATADGDVHELWWSPAEATIFNPPGVATDQAGDVTMSQRRPPAR